MYHQQPQQQGSQPFPNAPRPSHHQPNASHHPNHPNMQAMGFQFPRPNQLPDELESALAIRGSRDMDHRQIDHMNQSNQGSGTGIGQHGGYGSNPILLPADIQPGHQQGVDWSGYQPPAKLFAPTQQQPQSSQEGGRIPSWNPPISDSPSPQTQQSHGDGGRVEGQGLYTPESAGSILASFGLSNDDLEVLSHYPDDQLTPDTLPFILRDIQLNKSGKQTAVTSASSSSYSHCVPPSHSSNSPEVPSLLTVTQTVGKVIDYGHASRGTEESGTRETFKRELLSSERTVKMFPTATSVSKVDKTERRQVRVEHKEPSKHGDRDYRNKSCEKRKNSQSPAREFAPLPKSRNLDKDYRQVESKPRTPSETRNEPSSRRSLSSSSASRQPGSSKKLPTPTMISDFAAVLPKVYPHTCSLCHIQCDQEKDWVGHINTVDHTAACRDLRNKYPDWNPNLPSRSGRYSTRALWDPKDGNPFDSSSRSLSRSPSSPQGKYRREAYVHRPHGRTYSSHQHSQIHYHTEHGRFEHHHSGSHTPPYSHRTMPPSRESWPDKRNRESSGGYSHRGVKRPHDALTKGSADTTQHPSSPAMGYGSKRGPPKASVKSTKAAPKPAVKTTKMAVKSLPVKKRKKVLAPSSQSLSFADRLVYLTGIPVDATEQEVTDLVSSFGKINNVILLPCSEEESEKGQGQKASVCMMKAEDAQALSSASKLGIRDHAITASAAKKPEDGLISDANSKPDAEKDKEAAEDNSGGETDLKILDQKWKVLITGLPDSGWSECDIIHLVQSFGTPSDIILAIHMGKALVSFPDLELAEEIVKVHSFKPAMFKNIEVKMSLVKQQIGLNTPVALYNLFMGSLDPLESPALVGWSSLVVIRNVPDTPADSTEVLKLMRRFGTVIKSLVVNNMIICEMATTAMALSVYKRFLMFPCIIQNNPLLFYRKADPKAHTQTKIIPAYCDSSENKPADNSCAAAKHFKQDGVSHQDYREEKHADEKTETVKKTEAENLTEKESKNNHVKEEELGVSVSSLAPDYKPDKDDAEIAEVNKDVSASELGNVVETKTPGPNAETAMPEIPKMTQAMVNALLVECRTRTANSLNRTAAPPSGDQGHPKQEKEDQEKTADSTKDLAKSTMEEKYKEAKKQDKERKEREAKKEERRERERRERERRERERDEKARKDIERREWERRERRRGYDERSSGSRSSYRQEGHRPSWRDDRYRGASVRGKDQLEEDHSDEFPFNMSDFVTVDELGDVTDLPDLAVPMETSDKRDAAPQTEQQEVYKDTSGETTVTQETESDEKVPESKHVSSQTPQTLNSLESGQDLNAAEPPTAASHIHMALSETEGQPQPEASKDNISSEPDIMLASSPDAEPISSSPPAAPAQSTSNSPAGAESDERKSRAVDHREAQNEGLVKVSNKQVEQPMQDEEKTDQALEPETSPVHSGAVGGLPGVLQTEKTKSSEDNTDTTGENVKKLLPPYDPSKAVGMEYLFPKTGFFCKVCSRFFTGTKVAEICHCKTLKHYENLQKFLQNPESSSMAVKTDSS